MHTYTREIERSVIELKTIAMPRISTQEKYCIETWLGLVGIRNVVTTAYPPTLVHFLLRNSYTNSY